jgi:hypothetical protein
VGGLTLPLPSILSNKTIPMHRNVDVPRSRVEVANCGGNVDPPRSAGECRFTAKRGGMSIYREAGGNVDLSRNAGQCRFTAKRGGISIYHGPRGNVDLLRIAGASGFNVWRPAGPESTLCVCGKRSSGARATHTLASRGRRKWGQGI